MTGNVSESVNIVGNNATDGESESRWMWAGQGRIIALTTSASMPTESEA